MGLIEHSDSEGLAETVVGSRHSWDGDFLKVDTVEVTLPDGRPAEREVIRHPGGVAVVAIDDVQRVLLVRQYRAALERVTVEIPAGKLEWGEDPDAAIMRELEEETGYTAGRMEMIASIAVAAGYSDEIIRIYMATDLRPGTAHPDDDEFVAAEWVDMADFIDSVLDGRIEDSKTVIAALICDSLAHRI